MSTKRGEHIKKYLTEDDSFNWQSIDNLFKPIRTVQKATGISEPLLSLKTALVTDVLYLLRIADHNCARAENRTDKVRDAIRSADAKNSIHSQTVWSLNYQDTQLQFAPKSMKINGNKFTTLRERVNAGYSAIEMHLEKAKSQPDYDIFKELHKDFF